MVVPSPVLVARTAERAAVEAAYGRAREGRAVTVLVSGEAGIGKSRLVGDVVAGLPGEPLVLTGGCLELGGEGAPHVPFVAILRDLLRRWGRARVDALLPLAGSALAALLPGVPATPDRTRLLEEFRTLVAGVARAGPVVLVVEDLHWADASSRELFAYLARNLDDAGVLLVGTVRTGELAAGHPVRALLAEVGRRADVVSIALEPLDEPDVTALLAAIRGEAPDPALGRRVHRRSGGNPLFAEALSRGDDAASLRAVLLDRIAELPGDARELLGVVAVAGAAVSDEVVAQVSELPRDVRRQALRTLLERDQLVVRADGYAIRHDLIRQTVEQSLLPGERRELHGRYARALADDPAAGARLAEHWAAAGDPDRALAAAWQAAGRAAAQHALDERFALLDRVLALWDEATAPAGVARTTVLELAATAAHATGRSAAGIEHCTAALEQLDHAADPEAAARLLGLRGRLRHLLHGRGRADIEAALALAPPGADRTRGELLGALAFSNLSEGFADDAHRQATEALGIADGIADEALRARALLVLAAVETDLVTSRRLFADCRRCAEAIGDHPTFLTTLQWEATVLVPAGHSADAEALCRTGQRAAERLGLGRSRGAMLAETRAAALVGLGRWDEALQVVDDALADDPPAYYGVLLDFWRGHLALRRGETARADELIDRLAAYRTSRPDATHPNLAIAELQMHHELARGDSDAADRILTETLAVVLQPTTFTYERLSLAVTGAAVVAAWRTAHPRDRRVAPVLGTRLDQLRALVRANPYRTPGARAQELSFDAMVGDGDLASWDRAAAAWREVGHPFELATALTGGAASALASSNRSGAARRLREARPIAGALGAVPLLRRIDELAVRARLDDPTPAPSHGLTRRELQVLRVLAEGRSNADIATDLFISTNTVATHVNRVLTKLGVTSRTEAAAMARRRGLLGPDGT